MRGLPIGTLYLVAQSADIRQVVQPTTGKTIVVSRQGFDLLDGQQRVRALLVGTDRFAEEKRCLWVDLGASTAGQSPCLLVTSKAQPFGYDSQTGDRLRPEQRRKARENIEPDSNCHPVTCNDAGGQRRPAYDLDLFEGEVFQHGKPLCPKPPLPYGVRGPTFKLHELLTAWRSRLRSDSLGGVEALRSLLMGVSKDDNAIQSALETLDRAFRRVENAEVALLRIDAHLFEVDGQNLLTLFQRIGAGGTPLSPEEQLFSIYKHYKPTVRDAVDDIYNKVGRVLPPTKIAATALRIANASASKPAFGTPGVAEFAARMADVQTGEFRRILADLIPETSRADSHEPQGCSTL